MESGSDHSVALSARVSVWPVQRSPVITSVSDPWPGVEDRYLTGIADDSLPPAAAMFEVDGPVKQQDTTREL